MPLLSAFTPCGLLECTGESPDAELFYDELIQLYGGDGIVFDFTPGSYAEAKLYAWAMGLAYVNAELKHGGNQAKAASVYDLLPLRELDYQLTPNANDTIPQRQAALAARELLVGGASAPNLVAGLRAILGASFLAYVVATPTGGAFQPTVYPAAPGTGPGAFADVRVPTRLLQLVDPVATLGAAWCAYTNLDTSAGALTLVPGDVIVVQPGNTSQMEKVTVTAVAVTPPAGSNASPATLPAGTTTWAASSTYGSRAYVQPTSANQKGFYFYSVGGGVSGSSEPAWPVAIGQSVTDGTVTWVAAGASLCFQATFTKAHDVGAALVAGHFPYWWSTQRYAWIVVTAAAAIDAESRRKVNDFLTRAARGVSQWAIVQAATTTPTGGTVGPLHVNDPMGTQPIAAFTFTNSM